MKQSPLKSLLLPALALSLNSAFAVSAAAAAAPEPSWPKADPAAVAHWQSLRFGMFIHWGPVSLTGKEIGWSRGGKGTPIEVYDNLYKQFDPEKFNADEWVGIAKAAGMKYIVLTTKHHDGFCLWDTKLTDYNIMHTPFHRDVVKELADSLQETGHRVRRLLFRDRLVQSQLARDQSRRQSQTREIPTWMPTTNICTARSPN